MAERHLWLARLLEWLRHAPAEHTADGDLPAPAEATPLPVLRLRHLLRLLDRHPAMRQRVQGVTAAFWAEIDAASLLADFGFGTRVSLFSEMVSRLHDRLLPGTPETRDLAALFRLLFEPDDADWIGALDSATLASAARLLGAGAAVSRATLLDAITILVSAVHAAGYAPALRARMDTAALQGEPFRQLAHAAAAFRDAVLDEARHADNGAGGADGAGTVDSAGGMDRMNGVDNVDNVDSAVIAHDRVLREAAYLRALLDACRRAGASVMPHLEQYGVSVNIVFDLEQLDSRTQRIEQLVDCMLAQNTATNTAANAVAETRRLLLELLRVLADQQSVRALLAQHYSLLARQVAERSAESGAHYITRNSAEYRAMLRRAAGGGLVIAGTTFVKFGLMALGLSAFWAGFAAGANYAISFVLVMLLHWTVATKQPAMTAPALAASLPAGNAHSDEELQIFVDRVAQLIRSQAAGIAGNLALCGPLVLAVQWLATMALGKPLVGLHDAQHVLTSITLLGPTALFAAFTGVLLFASSLIAGWAENWFVFHRLDSAIAWNPRIVSRLGPARARRWAHWWRANVSGLAANVSLGMMLGLVPALFSFFALPLDVRHVTLASGQLAAALGAIGPGLLAQPVFWWCVAGIAVTGVLNLTVSFGLAFAVALRSRGVRVKERARIEAAIWRRLRSQPLSFLRPPKTFG